MLGRPPQQGRGRLLGFDWGRAARGGRWLGRPPQQGRGRLLGFDWARAARGGLLLKAPGAAQQLGSRFIHGRVQRRRGEGG